MPLKSMTGFGKARGSVGESLSVEIVVRSVNHRFLDLTFKVREAESALEPILRRALAKRLSRGKVEVNLHIKRASASGSEITVDEPLLEALVARLRSLSQKYPIIGRLEPRDLLAFPQILAVGASSLDFSPEEIAAIEATAAEAANALVAMREAEGKSIEADLLDRIAFLRSKLAGVSARRDEIVRKVHETLRERVKALFSGVEFDPSRLEQEAALAADRSDVAEELSRLSGHLDQFTDLVAHAAEPVGKKLDFLSQEILRELNTLGSKARDLQLIREVLEMKSEIEKVREQVQNVE